MPIRAAILLALIFASIRAQALEPQEVEQCLRSALDGMAKLQRHGGWGRAQSVGGEIIWGEHDKISNEWITLQPPATPIVAGIFLRAGKALDEERYLNVALKARDAMLALQTAEGGFPHEYDPNKKSVSRATFDDDTTTACLRFFIDIWKHSQKKEDWEAVERVGDFIRNAAYPIGLWPQYFPPPENGYQKSITFNDNVVQNNVRALLDLHALSGDIKWLEAAVYAGDGIIKLQGGAGEEIWAQQYDPDTLEPAWARNFEPPGYSAGESRGVCDVLIDLYLSTGEQRFLDPLPKAFAWYEAHRLENGKWARLYEPGTQRPVYGRRDKKEKVYEFENATAGYGWQSDWFPYAAQKAYEEIKKNGKESYLSKLKSQEETSKPRPELSAIVSVCKEIGVDGLFLDTPTELEREDIVAEQITIESGIVSSSTFNKNVGLLLDFVK